MKLKLAAEKPIVARTAVDAKRTFITLARNVERFNFFPFLFVSVFLHLFGIANAIVGVEERGKLDY